MRSALVLILVAVVGGCSPTRLDGGGDATPADAAPAGADAAEPATRPDGGEAPERGFVFAHSNRTLYRVDADTLQIEEIGLIRFSDGINQLTDLAVDRRGNLVGISFREVYSVDPDTARATLVASLDRPFNGLSFIPVGDDEVLVGTAQDGTVFRIDPVTGVTTELGSFGGGIGSSGDVVGVFELGTLATAIRDDWPTDHLVRIDPATGAATDIADTGVTHIWGLGFWRNRLFGFAEGGEFVVIDAATGETELIEDTGIEWWGAAVTTAAPVVL